MTDDTADDRASTTLAEAAIAYAKVGYAVFELQPGSKVPYEKSRGLLEATTDVGTIRKWWKVRPDSNIGLRPAQGVAIIDVDSKAGHGVDGHATLAALIAELGPLPDAPTAETPTGGLHVWLAGVDGDTYSTLGNGVDVKTHSGYVVAPPSIIEDIDERLGQYRWCTKPIKPATAPTAWSNEIRKPEPPPPTTTGYTLNGQGIDHPYIAAAIRAELRTLAATSALRNNQLFKSTVAVAEWAEVDRGWLRNEVTGIATNVGLKPREINKTIKSAFDKADRNPPRVIPDDSVRTVTRVTDKFDDNADDFDGTEAQHSWLPVDLTEVLDGTWEPPKPTVGQRIDGVGLFYPGKKHTVSSESEAGKTWFALAACRDEILRENHVVFIDFEDDEGDVASRLMALGLDAARIKEFFHYIRPESPIFLAPNGSHVVGTLAQYRPTLAIVDGVTEAMTLHELDPNDNSDAAKFGRMLPRLLAESGAAAVSLDHVTKSAEGRGRYSIGAAHKLNGLDGAAYLLDNRSPFGVDMKGVSTIRIAKDRPGQLRRNAVPSGKGGLSWFADLIVDTTLAGMAEGVVTVAPAVDNGSEYRPTVIMRRVSDVLVGRLPDGLSQRMLCEVVTGKRETIIKALSFLILDGYVTDRTPHRSIRPYFDNVDSDDDDE